MAYEIAYKASVVSDLKRLDRKNRQRILDVLEKKLSSGAPSAEALQGEFRGLFRIRIGDYRVVFAKTETGYLVLRIAHRREVYR